MLCKRVVLCVALTAFLAGCAAPSQRQVEADVDGAVAGSIPSLDKAWAPLGTVQVGWIDGFNDPQLSKLVREAQANNQNLAASAAGLEQAAALARQAGASLVPQASLSTGATRGGATSSAGADPSTSLNVGLQVSWEADLWGRIRSGVSQAQASAAAAEADYRFAQYSLAANTAIAYFTAIEANLQTAIASEQLAILSNTQRIVEAQYNEGMASAQDLALTRSDLAAVEETVANLEGSQRDALRALELLLGRYPSADVEIREGLPAVPPVPPAGLPADLLERRPDLVAAERRVAAAFNAVNQAKAARLPSVSLTGSLGGASSDLSNLLSPGNVAWSLGTSLLAPIFDGGRLRENVNIANADQRGAVAQYAAAALQAFSDVESSLDQGQVLDRRHQALVRSAREAERAYELADITYKEGEIALIDLLAIQQRVISAKSNLLSVNRSQLSQRVNMHLALGGDWK